MADTPFDPTGDSDPSTEPALARDDAALARDEAVSAYLDGEATAAEVSMVEGSPDLLARVEVFRSLQAPIQAVPQPDEAAKNAAIAAAVAAVTVDPAEVASAAAAVVASRNATKRAPWYQRFAPGLVLASVLLAGVIAAPFILNSGSDDAGTTSTEAAITAFDIDGEKSPGASAPADAGAMEGDMQDEMLDEGLSEPASAGSEALPEVGPLTDGSLLLQLASGDAYLAGYASAEALADAVLADLELAQANDTAAPNASATAAPATTAATSELGTAGRAIATLNQFEERCAGDIELGDGAIYPSLILPNREVFVLVHGPEATVLVIDAGNCAVLLSQ